jgi:tetratricopeptide (TPR) repeat protein
VRRMAIGSVGVAAAGWFRDTLLTGPGVALRYLINLALPLNLALAYPEHFLSSADTITVWRPLACVGLTLAVACWLSRGSARRWFLLGSAALTMAPALCVGLLPAHALVQDRYGYLPLSFLSLWLADLAFTHAHATLWTRAGRWLLGLWLVFLLGLHTRNLWPWSDDLSLFTRAAAVAPDNLPALMNLAVERRKRGEPDPQCDELKRIAALSGSSSGRGDSVLVYFNLGDCEHEQGHLERALEAYDRAYALSHGGSVSAGANRVRVLAELQQPAVAQHAAEALVRQHPRSVDALRVLGVTDASVGDLAGAEAALQRAVALEPGDAALHALLARVQAARLH